MFDPVPNPPDFPSLEREILDRWERERIFKRSIEQREGAEDYVFYDGPPGTNAPPHIGHMMQSALKDLWPRFWTMRGRRVLRKAGWDTHGLPIELTADSELGLASKADTESFGVQKYVDHCRETVFRFKRAWEDAIHRLGRFLDMENFYATYKTSYIQSDWWVLKQAWEITARPEFCDSSNLLGGDRFLYKDYRISAWCPKQGTTLSNFEVAQGYQDVVELALYAKMRVHGEENLFLVVWTTTAWTLLSNIAVAAGPDVGYVRIRLTEDAKGAREGERLLVARDRLQVLEEFIGKYEVEGALQGEELAGMRYLPLWDFQRLGDGENGHYIIVDDYVTAEEGTGLVHIAPYGEDDHRLIKENHLTTTLRVNRHGMVIDGLGEFSDRWFKEDDLEIDILKDLHARGLLLGKEKHEHTYPFHYKTGSPLIYFPRPGWFIRTTAMREEMIEANRMINWYPEHIREGRFGKWLENVVDWNITRERFWGSPLPIWSSDDDSEAITVGSLTELREHVARSGGKPLPDDVDLHKPGIDDIVLKGIDGKELRREEFVLDSWFNAGIMPWGQIGYPAAEGSEEYFDNQYPADFICEGIDQTRGWFYSLLVASTLLAVARGDKDKTRWSSYRNVICTDLVLDENGEKMSKSKGNVVPPIPMMDKYGADAVRWSFYRNNPWIPIRFGEEALRESLRKVIIPLWNAYSFFVTYANVDKWSPTENKDVGEATPLDRWILTGYNDFVKQVTAHLEAYDVMPAAAEIADFLDRLTNWYIRRSRRRFWKSEEQPDKLRAYLTLYTVLCGLSRVLAPFIPFISDAIYRNLEYGQLEGAKESIHLVDWPIPDESQRDDELKADMDLVRNIVSLGHACRNDARIKVRQPLLQLLVAADQTARKRISALEDLILDELNVRSIGFIDSKDEIVTLIAKGNFKTLGPRFGKDVDYWVSRIGEASEAELKVWQDGEYVVLDGERLGPEDVLLEHEAHEHLQLKEEGDQVVALDTRIDEELKNEGFARELINKIQNRRKEMDLEVTRRINLTLGCDDRLQTAVRAHQEMITREVLAESIEIRPLTQTDGLIDINDRKVELVVMPV